MCMEPEKLASTSNEDLLKFYKRAVELQGGKGPHDIDQLSKEILRRMDSESVTGNDKTEVGDGHDEFS